MHSICVWNIVKQSKPLQTRYNTTYIYIYDRYFIRTHVKCWSCVISNKRGRVSALLGPHQHALASM